MEKHLRLKVKSERVCTATPIGDNPLTFYPIKYINIIKKKPFNNINYPSNPLYSTPQSVLKRVEVKKTLKDIYFKKLNKFREDYLKELKIFQLLIERSLLSDKNSFQEA